MTVEDSCIAGGAGSAVAEWCAANGHQPKILHLGLPDKFIDHGDAALLHARLGLDADGIARTLADWLVE